MVLPHEGVIFIQNIVYQIDIASCETHSQNHFVKITEFSGLNKYIAVTNSANVHESVMLKGSKLIRQVDSCKHLK